MTSMTTWRLAADLNVPQGEIRSLLIILGEDLLQEVRRGMALLQPGAFSETPHRWTLALHVGNITASAHCWDGAARLSLDEVVTPAPAEICSGEIVLTTTGFALVATTRGGERLVSVEVEAGALRLAGA